LEITVQNTLQLELCVFCLLALAIVWFSGDRRRRSSAEPDIILFYALLLSTASMLFATALVLLFEGKPGSLCRAALLSYPFPMLLAAALQTIFGDLILLWPTMALFVLTLAFNVESRHSKTDFLTGAANRRSLDEELERRIEGAVRALNESGRRPYRLSLSIGRAVYDLRGPGHDRPRVPRRPRRRHVSPERG
jgi:hypothetical protein